MFFSILEVHWFDHGQNYVPFNIRGNVCFGIQGVLFALYPKPHFTQI